MLLTTINLSPEASKKDEVVAQNMLVDMAIMMGTQFAAEAANEWVEAQDSVLYNVLTQASANIQNDFSSFQNKISTFESQSLTDIINSFNSAQKNISAETAQAQADVELESDYLMSMVSLDQPQTSYLFSPADYDSAFARSPMYTPSGPIWHNVFAKGDWEFDPATSSFWQYDLIDTYKIDSTTNTKTFDQAAYNSIFTEFFSKEDSYEIDGEITLYSVTYPFFAGIIFNKNRWISGDMSGLNRYRVVGIYGKSEDDIGIYYSEQYTDSTIVQTTTDASQMISPVQYPLDQIFNDSAQKLGSIDASEFKTISEQEVAYSFKITTTPNNISVSFTNKNSTSPTEIAASATSKDPSLFLYHGIGFISPGSVTKFNLTSPASLLFSSDSITALQSEINELMKASTAA